MIIESFNKIKSNIDKLNPSKPVNIVAISKTFSLDHIKPLIDFGHNHFGENKVQEAKVKWSELKKTNQNLNLHMVGKLQSNKTKDAVNIFDYIHSLDNQKLADALAKHQKNMNKSLKYFIQVNIGKEPQKSGIHPDDLSNLYDLCIIKNLKISGLMCIPPADKPSNLFFNEMVSLRDKLNENLTLSMGMSNDYKIALKNNSNLVRIGSRIFN